MFTAVFSYRLFYASLIRHLFHFDTSNAEWDREFRKAEKKMKKKLNKREKEDNKEAIDYLHKRKFDDKLPTEYTDMDKLKFCAQNDSSASEYSDSGGEDKGGDLSLHKQLGYDAIKEKMLAKLGYKTLKYDYKSFSIFKSIIC